MELEQPNPEDIRDEDIRDRYVNSSRNCYTQHYLATQEGQELGFLSLDFPPTDEPLVIYEIFVPPKSRRMGLGTSLLQAAEEMARRHGYEWSLVIPKTMDEVFPQDKLEAWYRNKGYEEWEEHAFGGIRKHL